MNDEEYIKDLEKTIGKFLEPIKGIPFHIAIKAVYGKEVFKFDREDEKNEELIDDLAKAAEIAGKNASQHGIFTNRPNEAGNKIADYAKIALKQLGLKPETPKRVDGKRQATGYPDTCLRDKYERYIYLEYKTYASKTIDSTQRTFYFSPPPEKSKSKIIYDIPHLMLSFEMNRAIISGKECYIPIGWKIVDLYYIKVDVKHEFNTNNRELYKREAIIREGGLQSYRPSLASY